MAGWRRSFWLMPSSEIMTRLHPENPPSGGACESRSSAQSCVQQQVVACNRWLKRGKLQTLNSWPFSLKLLNIISEEILSFICWPDYHLAITTFLLLVLFSFCTQLYTFCFHYDVSFLCWRFSCATSFNCALHDYCSSYQLSDNRTARSWAWTTAPGTAAR